MARESVDTLGLVIVKHTVEPDPHADFVGHGPTHVVETIHEPIEGETVGELLARLGLDEGDRVEIRFPTVEEDRQRLVAEVVKAIDAAMPADPSLCTYDGPMPEVVRDADGNPAPFESFPSLNGNVYDELDARPWPDYRDERTASR